MFHTIGTLHIIQNSKLLLTFIILQKHLVQKYQDE